MRELKWKKAMDKPRRRDEEDKDYENRWTENTEAWGEKGIWNKWRMAEIRKYEELEEERIVFESEEMICIKNKETGEFRWEENSIKEERPVKRRKLDN
uniref:Uncharacterized protein n=1 Tax=Parastrongyloides trichosuri TaxID=131310 RepID=A0A0N4ZD98_PARTI